MDNGKGSIVYRVRMPAHRMSEYLNRQETGVPRQSKIEFLCFALAVLVGVWCAQWYVLLKLRLVC